MLNRRTVLRVFGTTGLLLAGGVSGWAGAARASDSFGQLRVMVPAAPGGGWDTTARSLEAAMRAEKLVDGVQITNVPGAGGAVALPQFVNQWRGRGDSLMVGGSTMISAIISNKSPVDLSTTTPVARLTGEALVIAVPASSPYGDLRQLLAAFREKPEAISWCGGSIGGGDHIVSALLARSAGVDPRQVKYVAYAGGGEAVASLIGGHVQAGISGYAEFADHFRSGKLRALALTSESPLSGVDVPTLRSQGVDVAFYSWRALFAPPAISTAERDRLTALVDRTVKGEAWKAELTKRAWLNLYLPGPAFATYIGEEQARIHSVLSQMNLG